MGSVFQTPSDFLGKRVIVMGLGLHGGGLAVAQWLIAQGARVCITDLRSEQDLLPSVRAVKNFSKELSIQYLGKKMHPVEWMLGGHQEETLARADLIIQNPGVPFDSPHLFLARSAGVPIENEATLFLSLTRKTPKIGVTGTRGKSTTVVLIHRMLLKKYSRALCAGIAGIGAESFFSIINTVIQNEASGIYEPVVIELSSYQLEHFSQSSGSVHIAVVTNILSDHLNRHKTLETYTSIKENIVRFQGDDGFAVLNYDNSHTRAMGERYRQGQRRWFSRIHAFDGVGSFLLSDISGNPALRMICVRGDDGVVETVCSAGECILKGEHNIENILAASAVARCVGISCADVASVAKSFRGLSSRQEVTAIIGGRTWVNDTAATSPDAVSAALHVFGARGRVILIAGGADKNLDFTDLAADMARYAESVVFFSGTATPRLADAAHRAGFSGHITYANSMHDAVLAAWDASRSGDIILLSPGCASFGMFVHEFDRGEQFGKEVRALARSLHDS